MSGWCVTVRRRILPRGSGIARRQMGKEKTLTAGSFFREVFQVSVYKGSQGRIARQVTCAVVWRHRALLR